jgi:hypothetical protein
MKSAMFMFVTGLLVTFGAVGGIEASTTDSGMIDSVIVGIVGLLIMGAGSIKLSREQLKDNSTL